MPKSLELLSDAHRLQDAIKVVSKGQDSFVLKEEGTPVAALIPLERLSMGKQARLDDLAALCNEGRLTPGQRREHDALGAEAEQIALRNARRLAGF